jgi:ATP-dependent DNA helicase RecG
MVGLHGIRGFAATGVRDAAKMSADLASWCSTEMEPPLRPLIRVHRFEGVDLVVAEIPELDAPSKPCFYRVRASPRAATSASATAIGT